MKKMTIAAFLLCCLLTGFAHEYILLASDYRLTKGGMLEMHLFVSDGFNIILERPVQTSVTKKFELISEMGNTDLLSTANGTLPVVNRKVEFEGLGLIRMERDYAKISLPATDFLAYLKEDHIENIKVKKEDLKLKQTERYTRYIKALVQSGPLKDDTLHRMITGQNFEILLLQNPYRLRKGDRLEAQVLFMGKPLIAKVITARNRTGNQPAIELTSRTDSKGLCSFRLQRRGDWFIHATHMIPCPDKAEADWESFWTTYSFGIE